MVDDDGFVFFLLGWGGMQTAYAFSRGRRQLASMNAGLNSRLASGGSTATVGGVVKDGWREKDMYEDRSEEEGGDTSKGNRSVRTQCDWRQRIP